MLGSSVSRPQIYLDHAATGWPKHPSVVDAMMTQIKQVGVAAGRGNYRRGSLSTQILCNVRLFASRLFNTPHEGRWVLTHNGTAALNQAIFGILQTGDHVVTTQAEHNSVLRPLHHLASTGMIELDVVPCDARGHVAPYDIIQKVQPSTRLLAVSHGSNVTGALFQLEALCESLKTIDHPSLLLLVDAAQTAGVIPIDIHDTPVDFLAMPGHKGLGGPLGTGLLYCGPKTLGSIRPLLWGGTGSQSDQLEMPSTLPDRLEAGNQNVPALAGLLQGLQQTLQRPLGNETETLFLQVQSFCKQLRQIPSVVVFSAEQLPIVSLRVSDFAVQDLAIILDSEFGIETRAGLHCSPLIHKALGTFPDGTLRISFSSSTPDDDLAVAINALQEIALSQ